MLATNALGGSNGFITFWTVNNPATTPTLTATNLLVATWNGFTVPDCPQLGGGAGPDSGDTRMQRVIERNGELADSPQLVNDSPYGDGWMIAIEPADLSELDALLDARAYREFTDREAGSSE